MAAQVEVELGRVCDGAVHRGACRDVTALPHLQRTIRLRLKSKTRTLKRDHVARVEGKRRRLTRSALSEQKRRVW